MSARKAKPASNIREVIDDLVASISLIECAQRSLGEQDIGAPEQVTLEQARKLLWSLHDALDGLEPNHKTGS